MSMSATILGNAVVTMVDSIDVARLSRHKEKKTLQNFKDFFGVGVEAAVLSWTSPDGGDAGVAACSLASVVAAGSAMA